MELPPHLCDRGCEHAPMLKHRRVVTFWGGHSLHATPGACRLSIVNVTQIWWIIGAKICVCPYGHTTQTFRLPGAKSGCPGHTGNRYVERCIYIYMYMYMGPSELLGNIFLTTPEQIELSISCNAWVLVMADLFTIYKWYVRR